MSKRESLPEKPDNVVQLIFLMWNSLDWRKVGQAALLMVVAGFAIALVVAVLAFVLIGLAPPDAACAAGVGGGVGAIVYGCLRRRARP